MEMLGNQHKSAPIFGLLLQVGEPLVSFHTWEACEKVLGASFGKKTLWLHVEKGEEDLLAKLCTRLEIPPLLQEALRKEHKRPKVLVQEDQVFLSAFSMPLDGGKESMTQMAFVVTPMFLLTYGKREDTLRQEVSEVFLQRSLGEEGLGSRRLLYHLLSQYLDGYESYVDALTERMDLLEEEILADPSKEKTFEVRGMKKELLEMEKVLGPLKEVLHYFTESPKGSGVHFSTLLGALQEILAELDTHRELLSGLMDISLSSINYKLNEVMKVLTIISTIFIPISFVTGLYGMNFKYMPELSSPYGYPVVLLLMGSMTMGLLAYFHKKKWF